MYLQNKYSRWYYNIINSARARVLVSNTYYEKHHIIPKSLGGTANSENLVKLTAKEHFICHLLLPKITTGNNKHKMIHAFWFMSNPKKLGLRYKPSSKIYELAKLEKSKLLKSIRGKDHPNFGKKHPERTSDIFTDQWRASISESKKGKVAWNKGIPRTQEVKNAVSMANIGKVPWNKGVAHNSSTIQKIKDANTGKRWVHNDTGNILSVSESQLAGLLSEGWRLGQGARKIISYITCQYCEKQITASSHTRWHGDNCKRKS